MNTIELLYQIFRARYSLDNIRQSLGKKYRLALVGGEAEIDRMRGWLGEPTLAGGGLDAEEPVALPGPLTEESLALLERVDAVAVHLGSDSPEPEFLKEQAAWLPVGVAGLWITEALEPQIPEATPADPSLPRVYRVDPARAGEQFPALCLKAFPELALRLARDYSRVRLVCSRGWTSRTAAQMALVAAASSVTVSVPVVGQLLGLLAVSGETLVITASQLRLCLLVGALYGRPLDFFDRVDELWPVIGGAVGWRTLARQLVGFIPGAGPVVKAGLAYSGTWMVGECSRLFYELGERLPEDVRARVEAEAHRRAREQAGKVLDRLRQGVLEDGIAWPEEGDEEIPLPETPAPAPPAAEPARGGEPPTAPATTDLPAEAEPPGPATPEPEPPADPGAA